MECEISKSLNENAEAMEEGVADEEMPVSVLLITDDGQLNIRAMSNGEATHVRSQPGISQDNQESDSLVENSIDTDDSRGESEASMDHLKSGLIEDYLEVCISYKCKECSHVSNDEKEFSKHCLNHFLKDPDSKETTESTEKTMYVYLCSSCSKPFDSSEETKEHMVREHNLKGKKFGLDEFPDAIKTINVSIETEKDAKIKSESSKKKRKLNEIIQGIDPQAGNINNLNYFCRKRNCRYKFRNEKDLEIHEKCHLESEVKSGGSKRLYQCFECRELFNGWHNCCSHLYKVHEIDCDLLKCPICETYRTSLPIRLENHIRIHSDVRAFTCKYCGKTFKQASQMRNHVIVHADKSGAQKPNWSRSKQCNICFKMYSDSKSLKKHKEEVHSKLRPFVCTICGHASARKSMLLMHQRQHTGQKPHRCELCNFKTADHNSLRKHLMRHTGVRPYKCPHCDYTAIQSGSYKNHVRIVHPHMEGMYGCSVCNYKTISEDNYIRHISDHLTGLIKEDGVGGEESKQGEKSVGSFLPPRTIFFDQSERETETEESPTGNRGGSHSAADTGGITIPAEAIDSPPEGGET